MPNRTTIVLPPLLKERAVARAREQKISFGEFVRRSVAQQLAASRSSATKQRDPFQDSRKTFTDDGPADLSSRLDDFLYGGDR